MHTYMYDKSLTLRYISLISRCKQASGKLDHLHSLHTSDPTGEGSEYLRATGIIDYVTLSCLPLDGTVLGNLRGLHLWG